MFDPTKLSPLSPSFGHPSVCIALVYLKKSRIIISLRFMFLLNFICYKSYERNFLLQKYFYSNPISLTFSSKSHSEDPRGLTLSQNVLSVTRFRLSFMIEYHNYSFDLIDSVHVTCGADRNMNVTFIGQARMVYAAGKFHNCSATENEPAYFSIINARSADCNVKVKSHCLITLDLFSKHLQF